MKLFPISQNAVWKPLAFVFCFFAATMTFAQTNSPASDSLCIATYNLRYASSRAPHSWQERRPLENKVIRYINPDVLGTQEGLYAQLKDIASDLPDYTWIGLGREGGSRGEFMAVFYRKARLEPLAFDHFWLSDTPDVIGSSTWGNRNRRMVTWVKFLDHRTGRQFYFFNTHFDNDVQAAREKSAALVRERVAALGTDLPIILSGDFNSEAGNNKAYSILTKDNFFKDTWVTSPVRRGEGIGTFNGFKSTPTDGVRIDWILTRGNVKPESIEIVTNRPDGKWASDHFPVVAHLEIGK